MKSLNRGLSWTGCLCLYMCLSSLNGNAGLLSVIPYAQCVGVGTYTEGRKITAISTWYGDLETNTLSMLEWRDGPMFFQDIEPGDRVVFFSSARQWNPIPSNIVYRGWPPSAWEQREKLVSAGVSALPCPESSPLNGIHWVNVGTNDSQILNYVSNIVHTLHVSPDLIQYSQALVPAIEVNADSPLFLFKGDAMLEMLALEWSESEEFREYVLNSSLYPRLSRGSALFQLKKRFDWPATNTVPEL